MVTSLETACASLVVSCVCAPVPTCSGAARDPNSSVRGCALNAKTQGTRPQRRKVNGKGNGYADIPPTLCQEEIRSYLPTLS